MQSLHLHLFKDLKSIVQEIPQEKKMYQIIFYKLQINFVCAEAHVLESVCALMSLYACVCMHIDV